MLTTHQVATQRPNNKPREAFKAIAPGHYAENAAKRGEMAVARLPNAQALADAAIPAPDPIGPAALSV
jgi:hypothetical protein